MSRTNGSVTLLFAPVIAGNQVRLRLDAVDTKISNDVVRAFAKLSKIDEKARCAVAETVERVLSEPTTSLRLPDEIAAFGVGLSGARFESGRSGPLLVLYATLPPAAAILF